MREWLGPDDAVSRAVAWLLVMVLALLAMQLMAPILLGW